MKKMITTLAIISGIALVLSGCAQGAGTSSGSGSGTGTTAASTSGPAMGSATDVAASGATSVPATQAEATTLYTDASTALSSFLSTSGALASINAGVTPALAAKTTTTPISFKGTGKNGGTVNITGTMTSTSDAGDMEAIQSGASKLTANTTYNMGSSSQVGTISGTIASLVTNKDTKGFTYTINGKISQDLNFKYALKMITGTDVVKASDAKFNMDIAFVLSYGTAYSVKRSDGVGAKFIISYKADYSKSNIVINMTDASSGSSGSWATEISTYLASKKATLSVYDDANKLLYSAELSANQIPQVVNTGLM